MKFFWMTNQRLIQANFRKGSSIQFKYQFADWIQTQVLKKNAIVLLSLNLDL